ncbi:DUF1905 domain-containing protein [Mucilaginibacter polytrichastri]|uniref:DUF1905 domain-containing protein n=1 Tax=Mucilaginibacter polytrichastri TaxID=1302689 RepID=A0A1Q6A063_9SPHI|nr:DUF1905 domain-containing protein [Mucilaginibacter polytrichastri]OKS87396.1 hypothetical protein RG47T_2857 [Mucilaginibacter polytrichastri]SFT22230.1 protein of unknown function [Mucilaginibacter polytrichastri]
MKEILKNKKLVLQHIPGKGAWTYHLVIPGTKEIRGRWGFMKVSGTIDGYEFKDLNLAPLTGEDKRISINGDIRKAIGKGGGDKVVVTMYKTSDNRLTHENEVKDCFKDADVYKKFTILPNDEQEHVIRDILSQYDEDSQEKKIIAHIKKLS